MKRYIIVNELCQWIRIDTPHGLKPGILGSLTAACTVRGLTWSPRALGSGVSRPTICSLRQQAQTFIQDVFRGVDVPVVDSAAGGASPLPDSQIFGTGPLSAADGAELAGREEAVYRDHLFPVPRRLVLQLSPELAPGGIRDRPGQFVVLDHVLRSQSSMLIRS